MIFRTSTAHEEASVFFGGDVRDFSINTKSFCGENGVVKKLHGIRLEWAKDAAGRYQMKEVPGTEFELTATCACWRWASSTPSIPARSTSSG